MSAWLYLTVFPGGPDRMDAAVRGPVATVARDIRRTPACDRWFFIRYFDERGPHVRLRAHSPQRDAIDALQRRVEGLLRAELPGLAARPGALRRPLLPSPPSHATSDGRHVGLHHAVYEPEWDKYGGEPGVEVAERLFGASSDLVLELDAAGLDTGERAALSLRLMAAMAGAGVPPEQRRRFWLEYALHWTAGGSSPAGSRALRVLARAAEHVEPALTAHAARLDEATGARVDAYGAIAARTLAAARERGVGLTPGHLCFHHVHMTNNRLGMTLVEEALLAVVLARAEQEAR